MFREIFGEISKINSDRLEEKVIEGIVGGRKFDKIYNNKMAYFW